MDKTFMEFHAYTFQSILGNGMFGIVVKAYSSRMKKMVAIKIIDIKNVDSYCKQKFLCHEKKIIKSLKHPNIIRTYEIFESRIGTVYMVMENCSKGDLEKLISVRGPLTEQLSCRLFKQLCLAVQYLHNINVAHRDLKCENLLLDTELNLKVCDFGLSKSITYTDGRMVLSKTYCGTSSYAAPEVLKNYPYNPKVSDVWSMGVVLYRMLYASMPFSSTNILKMIKLQMERKINFPTNPLVSSEVKNIMYCILHPVVEQRHTVKQILESPWVSYEKTTEDGAEASTSTANSDQAKLPDEKVEEDKQSLKDSSDAEEGPSAASSI